MHSTQTVTPTHSPKRLEAKQHLNEGLETLKLLALFLSQKDQKLSTNDLQITQETLSHIGKIIHQILILLDFHNHYCFEKDIEVHKMIMSAIKTTDDFFGLIDALEMSITLVKQFLNDPHNKY